MFLKTLAAVAVCAFATTLPAQGPVGWLRYAIPPDPPRYHDMPHAVVLLGDAAGQPAPEEQTAADELDRGLGHMVAGTDTLLHRFDPRLDSIILGSTDAIRRSRVSRVPGWTDRALPEEGFRIVHLKRGARQWWVLQGGSPRAELYAAYRFAALVAEDQQLPDELTENAAVGLRALNVSGNMNEVLTAAAATLPDTVPNHSAMAGAAVLARLLSSVTINALVLPQDTPEATELAAVMRPHGIALWLSTQDIGQLTALASQHAAMANFGGIVLHTAPGVEPDVSLLNAAARTLRAHGASLLVEDALGAPLRSGSVTGPTPEQRAAALHGLEPNIILGGAAVSPLLPYAGIGSGNFGLLPGTPQVAGFPVTPGHSREVIDPLPSWLSALKTPERGTHGDTTLLGALAASPHGGVVGTISAEDLAAAMQQPLLQANLFSLGRMAWNPNAGAGAITEAWARQTWGDDARVFGVAMGVLTASETAFRNNSSPFGMVDLGSPNGGPEPAFSARKIAGKVPVADTTGIGVDRTAHGTDEVARFPPNFAAELSDPERCPEEWLLAVQRVPLTHRLRNGKTIVQDFYDAHFAGASEQVNAVDAWETTKPLVDATRYAAMRALLESSAVRAEVWRDATTEWMERATGVTDSSGFVGNHSGRIEAESMTLEGFARHTTEEREDASGGAYVLCAAASCTAASDFHGEANVYRIETGYFDGAAGSLNLSVNGTPQVLWPVAASSSQPGGTSAERFVVNGIHLKPGDHVAITGTRGGAVDFLEITRDPRWN